MAEAEVWNPEVPKFFINKKTDMMEAVDKVKITSGKEFVGDDISEWKHRDILYICRSN